jgi:hypothetical protein
MTTSDGNFGAQNSQNANMVHLQSLLQGSMVQVSAAEASMLQKQPLKVSSANSSSGGIPLQLSIPGLSAPVTLSVNLPDGVHHQGGIQNQQISKSGTFMTSTGKIMTTHASVGGTQTVYLQGAGGNLIQLPQQAVSSAGTLANVIKPLITSSGHQIQLQPNQLITGGHLLQVRQATGSNQQVFLQMPTVNNSGGQTISAVTSCGQPFQIVRSVPQSTIVRPQQPSPQHQQQQQQHIILNNLKSPSNMGGSIPQSPNSVTSPPPLQQQQLLMSNPDSNNLVAIQLQNSSDSPAQSQQILLATHGGAGGGVNHLTQAAQLRVRQQRKQSLK